MQKIISFLFLILLVFPGCTAWDLQKKYDQTGLLKEIQNESRETIAKYKYNKEGLLVESWSHMELFMNNKNEEYEYVYNSDGQLTEKSGTLPGNMMMSSTFGASEKEVNMAYRYDSLGRIESITTDYVVLMDETNFSTKLSFEYLDEKTIVLSTSQLNSETNSSITSVEWKLNDEGNIYEKKTSYTVEGETRLSVKEELSYDDKNAPVTFDPTPASLNNVTESKQTVYNYDENGMQSIAYISTFTYVYEYDELDYPIKMTETYPNEIEIINYYIYL